MRFVRIDVCTPPPPLVLSPLVSPSTRAPRPYTGPHTSFLQMLTKRHTTRRRPHCLSRVHPTALGDLVQVLLTYF